MAKLTRTTIGASGIADLDALAAAVAAGGDTYPNDDRTVALIYNGSGSSVTVTPTIQRTTVTPPGFGQVSTPARALAIAASKWGAIHCPGGAFNDVNGEVALGYSAAASVKAAIVRLPALDT